MCFIPNNLHELFSETWETTTPTAGFRDPALQIINPSRRTIKMIGAAGLTDHCSLPTVHCGTAYLFFFLCFPRKTMKLNMLGIIFSETKANKDSLAPESVQFSPVANIPHCTSKHFWPVADSKKLTDSCLAACSESLALKGHGFSRAVTAASSPSSKRNWREKTDGSI
jgi:hypothetical protein